VLLVRRERLRTEQIQGKCYEVICTGHGRKTGRISWWMEMKQSLENAKFCNLT